jgi:hypothetical protein
MRLAINRAPAPRAAAFSVSHRSRSGEGRNARLFPNGLSMTLGVGDSDNSSFAVQPLAQGAP